MIDPDVLRIVENRVSEEMQDRHEVFARELTQIRERAAAMDSASSGGVVYLTFQMIGGEFRVRSALIWGAFARALSASGTSLDKGLASEVKDRLCHLLDDGSSDLRKYYDDAKMIAGSPSMPKSIAELRDAAIRRTSTEVDYALLGASLHPPMPTNVVNIYQSYGIVQTGPASSASLSVSLGNEELKEIKRAIESARFVIEQSSSLGADQRTQTLELIDDAEREVDRAKPNVHKIRGALLGIAVTVQALAAAPQAYQLLKGAASLVGLDLP